MSETLLLLCALSLGFAAYQGFQMARESLTRRHLDLRFQILSERGGSILPLEILLTRAEGVLVGRFQGGPAKNYEAHLRDLLRRADRRDLKPYQLLGYQILAAVLGASLFGLLAESWFLA